MCDASKLLPLAVLSHREHRHITPDLDFREIKFWLLLLCDMGFMYFNDSGLVKYMLDTMVARYSDPPTTEAAATAAEVSAAETGTGAAVIHRVSPLVLSKWPERRMCCTIPVL